MNEVRDINQDWNEYRRLVLNALERIDHQILSVNIRLDLQDRERHKEISEIKVDIGMLKIQAIMWSLIATSIASIIVSVLTQKILH